MGMFGNKYASTNKKTKQKQTKYEQIRQIWYQVN